MLRPLCSLLLAAMVAVAAATIVRAQDKAVMLNVGDKAPKFEGRSDEDKPWKSEDHVGKKILVVYFYPADMTPGCTKEACSYRDAMADLDRSDVEVVGVSGDTVENHQNFKREYKLNFTLLADPIGKIAKAFGVKTSDGGTFPSTVEGKPILLRRGITAARWTFVIDKDGRIVHKDDIVDPTKDSEKVSKVVEELAKSAAKPKSAGG